MEFVSRRSPSACARQVRSRMLIGRVHISPFFGAYDGPESLLELLLLVDKGST
jgi:hypothetical protein